MIRLILLTSTFDKVRLYVITVIRKWLGEEMRA